MATKEGFSHKKVFYLTSVKFSFAASELCKKSFYQECTCNYICKKLSDCYSIPVDSYLEVLTSTIMGDTKLLMASRWFECVTEQQL